MKKQLILAIVLMALLYATYQNHFGNTFHFDDSHTIESNMHIRNLENAGLFFTDASSFSSNPSNQTYRPLVSLSFAIDYHLAGGLNPVYFHVNMFLFFSLLLILMVLVFKKILTQVSPELNFTGLISILAVAWFGFHTANAETMNYISARSDLYSTFFVTAAFAMYLYFPRLRQWQLYLVPVVIGMLTKEQTAMFAPMLFVYILLFEENTDFGSVFGKSSFRKAWSAFLRALPALLVCGLMSLLILRMQSSTVDPGDTPLYNYLITQPWVYLRYFIAFFIPVNLSADTDWTAFNSIFDERALVGFAFICALGYLVFLTSKHKHWRPVSFGIMWFMLALVPTSVVPLAEVTNDHRMFFAFVGLVVAVSWTLFSLFEYLVKKFNKPVLIKIVFLLLVAGIISGNALGVYQRNKVWKSEESLWYDVTIKSPNNARGLMNYGLTQMWKGDYNLANEYFTRAMFLKPYYPYLHINMGVLQAKMGNTGEAENYYKKAVQYGANLYLSHFYYASFLWEQNRNTEAVSYAEKALQLSPNYLQNRHLLANIYLNLNEIEKLKLLIDETLMMYPGDTESLNMKKLDFGGKPVNIQLAEQKVLQQPSADNYLNLSLEYYNNGMYHECIDACEKALKLNPQYAFAYNNICSSWNALGEWDKAIEAGEKALAIDPNYTLAANNLALARKNKEASK